MAAGSSALSDSEALACKRMAAPVLDQSRRALHCYAGRLAGRRPSGRTQSAKAPVSAQKHI